jgi:hypothetical protein
MNFTDEELNIIEYALLDRTNVMFRDYEAYKNAGNKEAMLDCLAEMRKANALRDRIHDEELKKSLSGVDEEIIKVVREKGEKDGNVYRIWFSGLNGVCNIGGYTDILCAHLGEDGILTFQVNTPNDCSTIFVRLEELPYAVAIKVIAQINATQLA